MPRLTLRLAASFVALILSGVAMVSSAVANPAAGRIAAEFKTERQTDVVQVGYYEERRKYRRRSYHRRKYRRKHGKRYYRRNHVHVDAPFTRYNRHRGRVAVDAPFAKVRRGRYGVYVRAPFVDLWVPRR